MERRRSSNKIRSCPGGMLWKTYEAKNFEAYDSRTTYRFAHFVEEIEKKGLRHDV